MGRIFLSHSSADNAAAVALSRWLDEQGWNDLFLDIDRDPARAIVAGERWERALNEAANRCEAVIFLVSRAWLASRWCLKEFNLALRLNKRMFGVLIEDIPADALPPDLTASWQVVRLAAGADHAMFRAALPDGREETVTFSQGGLASLKAGLTKAGLDARFFAWPPESDPDRPPWRGMLPLEAEDAGIFFGREAPVIEALDRLRGMADAAPPRFLIVLGASGAGKSSFLRAGLLPRLQRDDRRFLPLPVIRPERAAISGAAEGLLASLEQAFASVKTRKSRAAIRDAAAGGAGTLGPLLAELAEAARAPALGEEPRPPAPAIVLALDQAEELFNAAAGEEAEAFLALLAGLLALDEPRVIVLATIRSDAYERLQSARALEGVRQSTLSLPPLPRGAYQTVIEGPAVRLKGTKRALTIEPALTAALLDDIEAGGGTDALPLLAFTLGRLYDEHGGDGDLTLAEYEAMGRIAGSIEAAVGRAFARADADPAVPKEREARLALLRRGLIPWLAGIDPDTGAPRRLKARLADIPAEARPLIEHLVAERLLAKEQPYRTAEGAADLVKAGEATVEPVHEALLRQWGLLRGWLDEDFARLAALEATRRAARDWAANARDPAWLAHQAGRLEDAERLADRPDLWAQLQDTDRAYLAAARTAETERRDRELEEARKLAEAQRIAADRQKQVAVRTRIGAVAAILLAAVAAGFGWYGMEQARLAERKSDEAEKSAARLAVTVSASLLEDGLRDEAALLLIDASKAFDEETVDDDMRIAFHNTLEKLADTRIIAVPAGAVTVEEADALYFIDNDAKDVLRLRDDDAALETVLAGGPPDSPIVAFGVVGEETALFVRENLEIGKVRFGAPPETIGHFPEPPERPGRTYEKPAVEISRSGIVTIGWEYSREDALGTVVAVSDGGSSISEPVELEGMSIRHFSSPEIGEFLSDGHKESTAWRILMEEPAIRLEPHELSADEQDILYFARCLANGNSDAPYNRFVSEKIYNWQADHSCVAFGESVIASLGYFTSAGLSRDDTIIHADGNSTSVSDVLRQNSDYDPGFANFTWLGTDAANRMIGVLVNRDLLVFTENAMLLQQGHTEAPAVARFLGNERIAVYQPKLGEIIVYDWSAPGVRASLSAPGERDLVSGATPFVPFHKGTCWRSLTSDVGQSSSVLPDGRTLNYYDDAEAADILRLRDPQADEIFSLRPQSLCQNFSRDWKRVLFRFDDRIEIHDLEKIIASGTTHDSVVGVLAGEFGTASFAGQSHSIVTTDWTHSIRAWDADASGAWTSREIYVGGYPAFSAQTDSSGRLLLVMENTGLGGVRALLHSIPARREWMELGTEYKWLQVAISESGEIAVQRYGDWERLVRLPTLGELAAEAANALQPRCRPAVDGDPRSSACWPARL